MSIFGSSQPGSGKTLFKGKSKVVPAFKSNLDSSKLGRYLEQSSDFNINGGNGSVTNDKFALPNSSPPLHEYVEEDADEEEDEDGEEEEDDEDMEEYSEGDGSQDFDADLIGKSMAANQAVKSHSAVESTANGGIDKFVPAGLSSPLAASTSGRSPRGVKRSRGALVSHNSPDVQKSPRALVQQNLNGPTIAQDLSKRLGAAPLEEPDDLIIGTEECISALHVAVNGADEGSEALTSTISGICERLCNLWNTYRDRDTRKAPWKDEVMIGIGPDENAPNAHSAIFLSTLLLSLYHPPAAKGGQALAMLRLNRSTQSSVLPYSPDTPLKPAAYPEVLLDWLDKNHSPYQAIYAEVRNHKPNATAHDFYWDIIYKLAIRGKFAELIVVLKEADFRFARTAKEDGHKETGYRRVQLENVNMVIGWAIQALQACPALTDDDWHVPGNPWTIFRKHIEKALDNLINFAEGRDKDLDPEEPSFEASNFGLKTTTNDLSRSSRRAESRVPWTILQNLKTLYSMLLGGSLEILSYSENWVEGTIALTALWTGEDDEEVAVGGLATARRSLRLSRSRGPRLVDINPRLAYQRRIASAFARVTEGSDESNDPPMLPDTGKPLEVALSSIFEGDVDGAVGILRAMSLPISDAVVEIGASGGWYQPSTQDATVNGFDDEDMDLLSFDKSVRPAKDSQITRSAVMKEYARELFDRHELTGKRGVIVEGWELSIAVLARLGVQYDTSSQKEIRKVLERLPLDSDAQIDKILHICHEYDMPDEGRKIVEVRPPYPFTRLEY